VSRSGDIALLRALVARRDELREGEPEAFASMLERLEDEERHFDGLSAKQRKWVDDAAHRLEIEDPEDDPAKRNADVPRGREVEKPAVLRNLPKAPPGRKGSRP
jgi:hypothetical protein